MYAIFHILDIFVKEVLGGVQKCHGKESAHERVRGIAGLNRGAR